MKESSAFYRWDENTLHLFVKIRPKASKNELAEVLAETPCNRIKIRITALPIDGKANAHVIKLLSKVFKVNKGSITIKSGITNRNKNLIIQNPKQLPVQITPAF